MNFFCLLGALFSVVSAQNPLAGKTLYVNPGIIVERSFNWIRVAFQKELDGSIATTSDPAVKATLQSMRNLSSAYWLDVYSKISGNDTFSAQGILRDAASQVLSLKGLLKWKVK